MSFSRTPSLSSDSVVPRSSRRWKGLWFSLFAVILGLALSFPATSAVKKATTAKSSSAAKKPASQKTAAKKTTKTSSASKTRQSKARRSTRRRPSRTVRRRGQQQPTKERYLEIQQALQQAGHLEAEPSGKWDDASVESMKQFQEAHSIQPTGKINAISLIALGLGPKRGPAPGPESVLNTEAPAEETTPEKQ